MCLEFFLPSTALNSSNNRLGLFAVLAERRFGWVGEITLEDALPPLVGISACCDTALFPLSRPRLVETLLATPSTIDS